MDPGKLKIVGLYFEAENYDYEEVIKEYTDFGFHMIPGTIDPQNIYAENTATNEFRKVFRYSRGIIFNGGPDIPPNTYGEELSILTSIKDPYRHYFEISFLFHLLGGPQDEEFKPFMRKRPRYSVLGICLGMQTLNVASGGDLIQDIPSEIYGKNTVEEILAMDKSHQHRNYYNNFQLHPEIRSYFLHPLKIIPGRWMDQEFNHNGSENPHVFSSHHQAIDKLGKDLRVVATSMDGKIIDAVEHTRYPNVFGVQFHPEVDYLYQGSKKYKLKPEDEMFSLREELKEAESLEFHLEFWNRFRKTVR